MRTVCFGRACVQWVAGAFAMLLLSAFPATGQSSRPRSIQLMHRYPASRVPRPLAAATGLVYYGGPVISNVEVIAVFWTNAVDPGEHSNAPGFYSAVTNSPWMDVLLQYGTAGFTGGSKQTIGPGSYGGAITITPANTKTALTDLDIQTEIIHQITIGVLPSPQLDGGNNPNTLYMTYFPPGYEIVDSNGVIQSCVAGGFCAYHGTLSLNSELVPYGVIPDQSPGSGCSIGCGIDPNYINNLDSICSHELAESVTDPGVGLATSNAPPLAWYDNNLSDPNGGGEIGDICDTGSATATTTGGYTVQLIWSNADGACVASRPSVPTTATEVSESLAQAKFRQAMTFTATVTSQGVLVSSGFVTFKDGATILAASLPVISGHASYTTPEQSIGRHAITAQYSGTANFNPSTSPVLNQYRSPKPH